MSVSFNVSDLDNFDNNYRMITSPLQSYQGIALERYGADPAVPNSEGWYFNGFI